MSCAIPIAPIILRWMASTSSLVTKPSRLVSSLANSSVTCLATSSRVITWLENMIIGGATMGGSGATGGRGGRGVSSIGAVPCATPGGGAVCAAGATDAIASAAIAPPIINFVMTPCLLLVIDRELIHPSLLVIERNRN